MSQSFSIVPSVPGKGGLEKITLTRDDKKHSCDVYLFGGTVTSWVCDSEERLFLSDITPFDGVKAVRGGIPLVFPQFGQPDKSMSQHGFARTSTWAIQETSASASAATVVLTLCDSESTRAIWPHNFTLRYTVTLSEGKLLTSLEITNSGDAEFHCQALLHTYIKVHNIANVTVAGLKGVSYLDKLASSPTVAQCTEESDAIVIDKEVDRIYLSVASNSATSCSGGGVVLTCTNSANPVVSVNHRATLSLPITAVSDTSSACVNQTIEPVDDTVVVRQLPSDCVLWNAWIEKTHAIGDLRDDAYLSYVCIEPGLVAKHMTVKSGELLTLQQCLSVPLAK